MGINKPPPIIIFVEYQDSLNYILLFVLSGWVQSSLQEELVPLMCMYSPTSLGGELWRLIIAIPK
jgi:hypothetical protein